MIPFENYRGYVIEGNPDCTLFAIFDGTNDPGTIPLAVVSSNRKARRWVRKRERWLDNCAWDNM